MNRGLLIKAAIEAWPLTCLFGFGIALFEVLAAYALPTHFAEVLRQVTEGALGEFFSRFVQTIVGGLLGADAGQILGVEGLAAMAWVHPILLALVWGHAIAYGTRLPAGEIEQGTIDILLGLPVSRCQVMWSQTAVWLLAGLVLILLALAGNAAGGSLCPPDVRVARPGPAVIAVNLYALYLAVGGLTSLISSLCDRRGNAVGVALGLVLASFMLSFLSRFWTPAERLSFLSMLSYYRPLAILHAPVEAIGDITVLLIAAAVFFAAAFLAFARRDVRTV